MKAQMNVKVFEVRDRMTFIPVLAVELESNDAGDEHYLLRRCGYPDRQQRPRVMLTKLNGGEPAFSDPYGWSGRARTMREAHKHIAKHFRELSNGSVVDVEYILGETREPKQSERFGR